MVFAIRRRVTSVTSVTNVTSVTSVIVFVIFSSAVLSEVAEIKT